MKNYMATFDYCRELLYELHIPFADGDRDSIVAVEVNPRLRRAVGRCTIVKTYYCGEKDFKIELNPAVVEDSVPDSELETTILHELLHTCPDCWNHGKTWSYYAAKVNQEYGYHVARTINCKTAAQRRNEIEPYKYKVICKSCGKVVAKRKRVCDIVSNTGRYYHPSCKQAGRGGALRVECTDPRYALLTYHA